MGQASDTIPLSCSPQKHITPKLTAKLVTFKSGTEFQGISREWRSLSLKKKRISFPNLPVLPAVSLSFIMFHLKLLQGHWVCHNWARDILGIRFRSGTHGSHGITPVAFQIFFGILTSQHIWVKPVSLYLFWISFWKGAEPNAKNWKKTNECDSTLQAHIMQFWKWLHKLGGSKGSTWWSKDLCCAGMVLTQSYDFTTMNSWIAVPHAAEYQGTLISFPQLVKGVRLAIIWAHSLFLGY